jgi:hypothetical protein
MSDSILRRTFLKCATIGTLVALPVATYAVRRWKGKNSSFSGTVFNVESLPIPDEVSGPFRTRACVSPDGKLLLLGGRAAFPKGTAKVLFEGGTNDEVVAFMRSFGQSLYVSSWPPQKKSDYRCVVKIPETCFIQAMAIHPATSNIAFLSRELWSERHYPDNIQQKINPKVPLLDVLYTVSLDGGAPIPIQASSDFFTREGDTNIVVQAGAELSVTPASMCWHTNGKSVYCHVNNKIIQFFLDGTRKDVYHSHTDFITSPLIYDNNGLNFIHYYCPNGNTPPEKPPVLVFIDDNGTIEYQKKLRLFTLGTRGCLFNAVFNKENWAVLTPTFSGPGSGQQLVGFKLDTVDLKTSTSGCSRKILTDIKNQYQHVDLCHFFPNNTEILATQFSKFIGRLDDETQQELIQDGGANSSQFLRIKTEQV